MLLADIIQLGRCQHHSQLTKAGFEIHPSISLAQQNRRLHDVPDKSCVIRGRRGGGGVEFISSGARAQGAINSDRGTRISAYTRTQCLMQMPPADEYLWRPGGQAVI